MAYANAKREPNVVAIGGGTGLSTFLVGLKAFPVRIDAVVTVADDGGSSGVLREDLKIPPPGDIRNVLVALSNSPEQLQQLLQFRFETQTEEELYLSGHPVGNLMLAAMTQIYDGDFNLAVKKMAEMLGVKGNVFPVSHQAAELCALATDGTVIKGESNFVHADKPLKEVFYVNEHVTSPEVLRAIKKADVIVLGPGSLYTSVIPNLIMPGVADAINQNKKADVVYICNIMTEAGESTGYSVDDHVRALKNHGISRISKVIVNDKKVPAKVLSAYEKEGATEVKHKKTLPIDYEIVYSRVAQIVAGSVRHDPIKTAATVYSIASDHI